MNAARSDAAHTITAAASHVPTPLIESPSEIRSVMISETSVAISATPPSAADEEFPLRITLTRNGVIRAMATVKITTAMMKPEKFEVHAREHEVGDDQAHGVRDEHHGGADEEPDHACDHKAPTTH